MRVGAVCLAALALMVSACAAPANDVPPESAPETAPETAAPVEEGDAAVKPEWDALDRVDDTCGIEALKPFLGTAAADLPDGTLKPVDRVLGPDSQATMDYVPERLNVLTNFDGVIIGLKCG